MADLSRVPNMGVAEFATLNYTSKKSYNVRGIGMQMESVVPAIGLSLLFNRTFIVSILGCVHQSCRPFTRPLKSSPWNPECPYLPLPLHPHSGFLYSPTQAPKLACYCDRYWTPLEDCRVPGASQQRLPFLCPMDYVLDPIGLVDDSSTLPVKWREHSFLDNPRCPDSVKRSKLTIYTSVVSSSATR